MVNSVTLAGRVATIGDLKETDTYKSCRFTLAVQESNEKCHFIESTAFGKNAENLKKYCSKGDCIGIQGHLTVYKDKDNHSHLSLTTDNISFLAKCQKKGE